MRALLLGIPFLLAPPGLALPALSMAAGLPSGSLEAVAGTARSVLRASAATRLAIRGEVEGVPFTLVLEGGGITASGGTLTWPVQARVEAGDLSVAANGVVAQTTGGLSWDLEVEAKGNGAGDLARWLDAEGADFGPVDLRGRLTGDERGSALSDATIRIGSTTLAGTVAWRRDGLRPRIEASLVSPHIDLDRSVDGADVPSPGPSAGARLIPDYRLVPMARGFDFDIVVKAERVIWRGERYRDVTLSASMRDERFDLAVEGADATGDGTVRGRLAVNRATTPPAVELTLELNDTGLARFFPVPDTGGMAHWPGDLDLELEGRGASLRRLLGNAAGHIDVVAGEVTRTQGAELPIWTQLVGLMLPSFGGQSEESIVCLAARFDIADGVARSDEFLLGTTSMMIIGSGSLALGPERLDLVLSPRPGSRRLLSVATPIRVTGTFAEPETAVASAAVALAAGKLVIGAVNPLALLGSLPAAGLGDGTRCRDALEARKRRKTPE